MIDPALRGALQLLAAADSTHEALALAVYGMNAPHVDVEFWLRVYCWIETVGLIRDAGRRETARQKVSPGDLASP